MLVRIDANAPREAIKMALTFAAENGFAVDFRSFGPSVVRTASPKQTEQPKAVKAAPKPKATAKPKASKKAKPSNKPKASEPTSLREVAFALRKEAENGEVKLPKEVYGDLRSKDTVRMTAAIKAATLILGKDERWCQREASTLMMALRHHEEFLHENPLLDTAK